MRNQLADLLEANEEWKEAAEVLMKVNMDATYSYAHLHFHPFPFELTQFPIPSVDKGTRIN